MSLCRSLSGLVGLVVELHVQFGSCGQSLINLNPELGVPSLCRIVSRLHHDTAAAILTGTSYDSGRTSTSGRSLLRNVVCYIVASQVTVRNGLGPSFGSLELRSVFSTLSCRSNFNAGDEDVTCSAILLECPSTSGQTELEFICFGIELQVVGVVAISIGQTVVGTTNVHVALTVGGTTIILLVFSSVFSIKILTRILRADNLHSHRVALGYLEGDVGCAHLDVHLFAVNLISSIFNNAISEVLHKEVLLVGTDNTILNHVDGFAVGILCCSFLVNNNFTVGYGHDLLFLDGVKYIDVLSGRF